MRIVLLVVWFSVPITAGKGGTNNKSEMTKHTNQSLPGIPLRIGKLHKAFTSFTIPSGQFLVFYAILDKQNALDLIRIHCVIRKSKNRNDYFNFVQVTISNGRAATSFSLPESMSNDSVLYEGARIIQPLEVVDFEEERQQTVMAVVSSRASVDVAGEIRFSVYDRSQYNVELPPSPLKEKSLVNQRVGYVRPISYRIATKGHDVVRILIESRDDICARLILSESQDEQPRKWFPGEPPLAMEFTRRFDFVLCREKLKEIIFMHIEVYPDDYKCALVTTGRTPNKVKVINITWSADDEVGLLAPISIPIMCFFLPITCSLVYATMKSRHYSQFDEEVAVDPVLASTFEPIVSPMDEVSSAQNLQITVAESHQLQLLHSPDCPSISNPDGQQQEKTVISRSVSASFENEDWSWTSAQFALILLPILSLFISAFGYGVYVNYGLEISMGLSLLCEAFASSIYHICPNATTYNLDTPFVQAVSVLLMLKLYGNRRKTIMPQFANTAVTSVIVLDSIITMFAEKSVLRGLVVITVITAVLSGILLLLLGPRLSFDRIRSGMIRNVSVSFAAVAISMNAVVILVFILPLRRIETTQIVTLLCVVNAFVYLGYYVAMKCSSGECWCKFSSRCIYVATVLWIIALYFFFKEETNWALTPAQSRALNRPCVLLSFFDYHDLWHITSALASLLLLLGASSLDDDLWAIPTNDLSVF
ncbi:hypothetical protein NECAME_07010 [Necator americanus]|uniref:SID1 transmembrane family member 1 n=1 Tax=Necator americanus TaxID=51031 RepID=W2TR89_NECAM|nr:hypothetical protein NECAME_07010 [Necator americanus]ETN84189.1 hypothetical protein NECAME_07010 [Necator americanus]